MRGRYLVLGAVLIAAALPGVTIALAASNADVGERIAADERFLLSCTGAMSTGGRADADRVAANAMVDLANRSVNGFGIGSSPIVVVNDAVIAFGVAPVDLVTRVAEPRAATPQVGGPTIEGTIDRTSGATRIVVHPAADPAGVLIAMTLDCAFEPALR